MERLSKNRIISLLEESEKQHKEIVSYLQKLSEKSKKENPLSNIFLDIAFIEGYINGTFEGIRYIKENI